MNNFWEKFADFLGRTLASLIVIFAIAIIASAGLKCLWFIWTRFLAF